MGKAGFYFSISLDLGIYSVVPPLQYTLAYFRCGTFITTNCIPEGSFQCDGAILKEQCPYMLEMQAIFAFLFSTDFLNKGHSEKSREQSVLLQCTKCHAKELHVTQKERNKRNQGSGL